MLALIHLDSTNLIWVDDWHLRMTTCRNVLNQCLQDLVVKVGGFLHIFQVKTNSYVASPDSKPPNPTTNFKDWVILSHVGLQFGGVIPYWGNPMRFRPVLCWMLTQRRRLTWAFVLEFIGLWRLHKATIVWPVKSLCKRCLQRYSYLDWEFFWFLQLRLDPL